MVFYLVECQPGTYYDGSERACVECPLGSYQHSSGQDTCLSCPIGYSTSYRGAISVSECLGEKTYKFVTEEPYLPMNAKVRKMYSWFYLPGNIFLTWRGGGGGYGLLGGKLLSANLMEKQFSVSDMGRNKYFESTLCLTKIVIVEKISCREERFRRAAERQKIDFWLSKKL